MNLLRFFPSHRALLAELSTLRDAYREIQQQNLRLQDRLDAALEDRAKLFAVVNESIRNERAGYQAQINFQAQRQGAAPIYPEAAVLPESALPSEEQLRPVARRMLPSEMIANARKKFVDGYLDKHAPKVNV
jgi:hypothetical protein